MKRKLLVTASLVALAFQVVGPAWAANNLTGTTIAVGPTDYQTCIWKQIKGLPCKP